MPQQIREWTLNEELGRGGMGVVYRARHKFLKGDWAVKVVRPELVEDDEARQRFLSEANVLSRLHHPNLIETQTPFEEEGRLYLPMEYLSGAALADLLRVRQGRWDIAESLRIVRLVSEGVGYCHAQNPQVLHRDLKPGNIQVMSNGGVKVLDFGLARIHGEHTLGSTSKAVGTPAYMPPEVLRSKGATPQSDVWALGMVLYRLLAGRLPYDMPEGESSIQAVFVAVVIGQERGLTDILKYVPDLPPPVAKLAMSALSLDPRDRPRNGVDFVQAIKTVETYMASLGVRKGPASTAADATFLNIDLTSMILDIPNQAKGAADTSRTSHSADNSLIKLEPDRPAKKEFPTKVEPLKIVVSDQQASGIDRSVESARKQPVQEASQSTAKMRREVSQDELVAQLSTGKRSGKTSKIIVSAIVAGLLVGGLITLLWWFGVVRGDEYPVTPEKVDGVSLAEPSVLAEKAVPAPPEQVKNPSLKPTPAGMVAVPAGTYSIGCTANESACYDDEMPRHNVNIAAFAISQSEVTALEYDVCVGEGACPPAGKDDGCTWQNASAENHPINCVSWAAAGKYCEYKGWRLPSESEWEVAARGAAASNYPWGATAPSCALTVMAEGGNAGCGKGTSAPAGSKPADKSWCGALDMGGNMREWVEDRYGPYPGGKVAEGDGERRVNRGGSWIMNGENFVLSRTRISDEAGEQRVDLGFRCALSL